MSLRPAVIRAHALRVDLDRVAEVIDRALVLALLGQDRSADGVRGALLWIERHSAIEIRQRLILVLFRRIGGGTIRVGVRIIRVEFEGAVERRNRAIML